MVHANNQLIEILKARGPEAAVDIDNAASRITLDVIGRVGFDKDFHATETLDDTKINRALDLMTAGGSLQCLFFAQIATQDTLLLWWQANAMTLSVDCMRLYSDAVSRDLVLTS